MAKEQPGVATLVEAKRWMRRHLTGVRTSLPTSRRASFSALASRAFLRSAEYRRARVIALFIGFGSEINTSALFRQAWKDGKTVLLPVTARGFHRPFFGLCTPGVPLVKTPHGPLELEPGTPAFPVRKVDLVVVPGLGFDDEGFRLGYGGGVYDRLLNQTLRARHVGLFFDAQRVHSIPKGRHDLPMAGVVTEKGFFVSKKKARRP